MSYDTRAATPQQGRLRCVRENVLGMMQISKSLVVFAWHEQGQVWVAQLGGAGEPQAARAFCEGPRDAQVLFGGRGIAVRVGRHSNDLWRVGSWKMFHPALQMTVAPEFRAIGLVRSHDDKTSSLITMHASDDRHVLRAHSADGRIHSFYETPARVLSWEVCPTSGLIALLTQQRQFIVVSAATRDLRLFVQTAKQQHESA
jgi:hypothetical protein